MTSRAAELGVAGSWGSIGKAWRRFRIRCIYWWRFRRLPDLDRPRRFTEWTQWRKLRDPSPSMARLTDKLHAKDHFVASTGFDLAVPTLWSGTELPSEPPASLPLIVKANHGCNQYAVVRTAAEWPAIRARASGWMRKPYGRWLDEQAYASARRLLLVEPFLGGEGAPLPIDYKVYVFGGRAQMIQIHEDRARFRRWSQFDRDWGRIGGIASKASPPAHLAAMFRMAEACARGMDFLRVDFYEVEGRVWFGEYCLYPASGLDPFEPDSLDFRLGDYWSAARR